MNLLSGLTFKLWMDFIRKKAFLAIFVQLVCIASPKTLYEKLLNLDYVPLSFVHLSEVDSTIIQDIRYAKNYNILGRPLDGYDIDECILTTKTAHQLSAVQKELSRFSAHSGYFLSLRVFDCYRPKVSNDQLFYSLIQKRSPFRKHNFNPNLSENELLSLGFVNITDAHSRGSTVSLTLSATVQLTPPKANHEVKTVNCMGNYENRNVYDFGIDMGTNYDCWDQRSFLNASLAFGQQSNRHLLKVLMENHGFVQASKLNWWEFTLKDEPFNETLFNFPIRPRFLKKQQQFCAVKMAASKPSFFDFSFLDTLAKKLIF